jgi:WD40 repeat protein
MSLEFDVSIESESEEDPVEDSDTVENIREIFRQQFSIKTQECSSLKKAFINHAANNRDFSRIAIGVNNEMQIYDLTPTGFNKYIGKNDFGKFTHPVSCVKFFNENPDLVMASSSAGEIVLYDLRSFKKVHTFEDDTEVIVKPVNCFDVNSNDRLLCAGSDELNHNVYLLFFDIRERRLMGGFFESHQEEVTDVKFHPTNPDRLASGSTDGLINVFDCKQESEDDALEFSLNTEDSVNRLKWHSDDKLSCITNTNDLLLYDVSSQDLLKKWERSSIADAIKRKSVIDVNIVDCHNIGNEMMYLATSNYNKGEALRSMKFNQNSMEPLANLSGNSQIIRTSLYNEKDNMYLTFGESALISVWHEGSSPLTDASPQKALKEDSSIKKKLKQKANPY